MIITHIDEKFPLLQAESQPCGFPLSDTDIEVIKNMDAHINSLGDHAVGLAAVQIGYPKKIFLIRNKNGNKLFINPMILQKSGKCKKIEGCLSLPGFSTITNRPKSVRLSFFDINGVEHVETFNGLEARIVMHEMEHLEGTLLSSHLEENILNSIERTSFGMKLTEQKKKQIEKRRKKRKLTGR
jgi:peptide deformylase